MRSFALFAALIAGCATLASCIDGEPGPVGARPGTSGNSLDRVMILEDIAACRFDAATQSALDGLLTVEQDQPLLMATADKTMIGGSALETVVEVEQHGWENGGGVTYNATASFAGNARWHGLSPKALYSTYVQVPDKDHYEERGIMFADRTEAVRAALLAAGHDVPIAPAILVLTRGPMAEGCGGAIQLRPEGDGTALACGYGC